MRAVVDSSVWAAAFLSRSGGSGRILDALLGGKFVAVSSTPVLEELGQALNRPRFPEKYGLTSNDVEDFMQLLNRKTEMVTITGAVQGCRDPNDDKVIETALRGGAEVIVTTDQDLHEETMRQWLRERGVRVLNVGGFLAELEQPSEE